MGKKVLIIEDEQSLCHLISKMFQVFAKNSETKTAQSGKDAVDVLQSSEGDFDLVLVDMHLPDTTGAELLQEIYRFFKNRNLPIPKIFLSTGWFTTPEEAKNLGFDGVLQKPFNTDELEKAFGSILNI